MKWFVSVLIIIINVSGYCQSTDSIYALREGFTVLGDPPTTSSLLKVDPVSGNSTLISIANFPFKGPFSASFSPSFIDPVRNKYCFIALPGFIDSVLNYSSSFHLTDNISAIDATVAKDILISVDLTTGVWEGVVLEDSHILQYNRVDNSYYALRIGDNFSSVSLVKIDPLTGYGSLITTTPIPISSGTFIGYPTQQAVIDPINKRLIFHGSPAPLDGSGIPHIYSIDLITGSLVGDYVVNDIDAIHAMAFNCRDTSLYGIKVGYTPNERSLIKINPLTFATTQISPLPYDFWYNAGHPLVITVSNNKYVFVGYDGSLTDYSIYSFDITSGTLTNSPLIDINDVLHIASYPVCKITPYIENSSCTGTATYFDSPSGGNSYDWNFGDPLSNSDNVSELQNPEHEFTTAGTYQIRLILNSCYTNDTIYKTIEVKSIPSPTLNLGPDRLLCPNESLQLSIPNSFNTILWNTGVQGTELLITTSGIYSVTVTDSLGCFHTDSIEVNYKSEETLTLYYENDSLKTLPFSLNNSWTINGIPLDSSGINSLYIYSSGFYQVIGTINGCIYSCEIDLSTSLCNLSINPNPTQGIVTVNSHLSNIKKIDIISIDGKILKQYFHVDSSIFTLDIFELSAGNYFLRIWTNNCESILKIIKV